MSDIFGGYLHKAIVIVAWVIGILVAGGLGVFIYLYIGGTKDFSRSNDEVKNKKVFMPISEQVKKPLVKEIPVLNIGAGLYIQGLIMEFNPTKKEDYFIMRIFDRSRSYKLFIKKNVVPDGLIDNFVKQEFPDGELIFKVRPWASLRFNKVEMNYSCLEFGKKA